MEHGIGPGIKTTYHFFVMIMSITRAVCYHSGTAAFGALPFLVRLIFGICSKGPSHSIYTRAFFYVVDKIKSRNRNPYVMCAIHGTEYNASAYDAIKFVMGHVRRSIAADTVTMFILTICQVIVVVIAMTYFTKYCEYFPVFASSVALSGAYGIVRAIFRAYDVAVDTLMLCTRKCFFLRLFFKIHF